MGLRELPQEGYYSADLYTVLYHRNPFRSTPLLLGELWVTAQDAEEALFVPYPIGFPLSGTTHQNFNATYSVIESAATSPARTSPSTTSTWTRPLP